MEINQLSGCCAVDELAYIGDEASPEDVLKHICNDVWIDGGYYDYATRKTIKSTLGKLQGFYIFTEVTQAPGRDVLKGYGKKLADYIKRQKLGPVVATRAYPNRVNHPNHKVKVYTWAPNQKAMEKWAAKNYNHKEFRNSLDSYDPYY